MDPELRGRALVVGAAVLWGTTGTARALGPAGASPEAVGAVRLAVGGGALLALALAAGAFRREERWPAGPLLAAAAGMAAYQPLFFSGVARAGVALGTVVAIGSAPILTGALAWVALGEPPGGRWAAATALAVAGTAILAVGGGPADVDPLGVLLTVGAGLSYALYATGSKRLLAARPPLAVAGAVFPLAALALAPVLAASDLAWVGTPRGALVALHLGLVATTLAYALFSRGLALVPTATAVTLSLAEPLTATVLGLAVLGERPGPVALVGAGLVLAGLALLALARRGGETPSRTEP